ncbi:MAG: PEP-CTERM sorting domain-containing protein [Planctomycetaceae bacterium]|jgi:hypothetical protein|nr:PEP-CTERM sorting domain-containing protein [Planctomycetaceae bacterium]
MKTTIKSVLVLGIAALCSTSVYAERLISDPGATLPAFCFQLSRDVGSNSLHLGDGIQVKDVDTNDAYRLFCTDLYTHVSDDYSNGAGQVYNPVALSDSMFHTDVQKVQLQSLFDHVYTKAFNADYSVKDSAYANIFQLAVWEIANDTASNLSLRDGDVAIAKAYVITGQSSSGGLYGYWDSGVYNTVLNTLDSWFDAIINDSWSDIGYAEDHVNLTVYMAEGGTSASQTFIGVAVAPEPATMLILGLGIAGLGLARKRRK